MTAARELSRLELAVLGLVFKGAPCTAYWVRRQFQESPSPFFSGSSGAVYPAVERLERRSLIRSTVRREGRRTSRLFRLTRQGKTALRDWLRPPLPLEDVAFTMDPLRTRVYYLDALPPAERLPFVAEALRQVRQQEAVVQEEAEAQLEAGDRFSHLGALGVLYEVRARIEWLEQLARTLDE